LKHAYQFFKFSTDFQINIQKQENLVYVFCLKHQVSEQKENMVDKSRCSKAMLNKIRSESALDADREKIDNPDDDQQISWRHLYFELKK